MRTPTRLLLPMYSHNDNETALNASTPPDFRYALSYNKLQRCYMGEFLSHFHIEPHFSIEYWSFKVRTAGTVFLQIAEPCISLSCNLKNSLNCMLNNFETTERVGEGEHGSFYVARDYTR